MKREDFPGFLGDYPPRHEHRCQRCGSVVYCAQEPCPYAKWIPECIDCKLNTTRAVKYWENEE